MAEWDVLSSSWFFSTQYHNGLDTNESGQGPLACDQTLPGAQDAVEPQPLHHCPYNISLGWLIGLLSVCEHPLSVASRSISQTLSGKRCWYWVGGSQGSDSLHLIFQSLLQSCSFSFFSFQSWRTLSATSSFDYVVTTLILPCLAKNESYHLQIALYGCYFFPSWQQSQWDHYYDYLHFTDKETELQTG